MPRKRFDFSEFFADATRGHDYYVERTILGFTEEMLRRMEELKITRSQLAERLGATPAYITKILRGTTNFTIESMVKIARALDAELHVHLPPEGARTYWFDELRIAVDEDLETDVSIADVRREYLPLAKGKGVEHETLAITA